MELLAGIQNRVREIRMVRRIWKMLSFQTESIATLINVAVLAGDCSIKKVSGIELNSRLSCRNFQHAAGGRFINSRSEFEPGTFAVDHEIVIIPVPELQLFVRVVN